MGTHTVDRITEVMAVLCIAGVVWFMALPGGGPGAGTTLAALRSEEIQEGDLQRFRGTLQEARRMVDSNADAKSALEALRSGYPGRHEVWVLSARYHEAAGSEPSAMLDYARAVRLEPAYLDKGSSLYLGGRIEAITGRVLTLLLEAKAGGALGAPEQEQLKAAYFLKRRLAGGCE
ncbi:MAG: hypothetical protein JSV00_08005 [bacterium]|nr:MAG: hypothetical protein JSV00_08005 [bacterium]